MSCGELFVNLGGGGSTPPDGMLQTTAALSSSLQVVKDNLGNSSALSLSTLSSKSVGNTIGSGIAGLIFGGYSNSPYLGGIWPANVTPSDSNYSLLAGSNTYFNASSEVIFERAGVRQASITSSGFFIGAGTITQNGAVTIKGSGGNILSLRNSSNVEKTYVDNNGVVVASNGFLVNTSNGSFFVDSGSAFGNVGYSYFNAPTNGFMTLMPWSGSSVSLQFGGTTSSFPALKRSSATLQTKLADDSAFAVHEVLSILTQKPTNSNAQKIKFGDKSPITDGALNALGFNAQWEVEINGSSYWFAGSTSAFA